MSPVTCEGEVVTLSGSKFAQGLHFNQTNNIEFIYQPK